MSEYDDSFAAAEKKPEEISVQPFDKEEWIQQKKAEREAAYLMIDQTAELLPSDGERIKTYLDLQSRFPRYSVGNVLLLSAQRPEATRIADYKTWKDSGAYIQKDETGIIILEPGNEYTREDGSVGVSYNAKRVFDISQTSAKEAPQYAEVVAVGPGTKDEDMEVKVGDKVVFSKYAGTEIKFEGEEYSIMDQSGILAVVEK